MRLIGLLLIIGGVILCCLNTHYTARTWKEERAYNKRDADYEDQLAKYFEQRASNPYLKRPRYPREVSWSDDDILYATVAQFGVWAFLAGCVLYVVGVVTNHHLELCKVLGSMTSHVSVAIKGNRNGPEHVPDQQPKQSAAGALREMVGSTQHCGANVAEPPPPNQATEPPQDATPAIPAPRAETSVTTVPEVKAAQLSGRTQLPEGELVGTLPMKVKQPVHPKQQPVRRAIPSRDLSPWWPTSTGGSAALGVTMGAAFIASFVVSGGPIGGFVSAGIYYFVIIGIRYFTVVSPNQKNS